MKRGLLVTAAIVILGFACDAPAQADPPATPINHSPGTLMRTKMVHSQRVLEALLRKDFDGVARGAEQMKRVSEAAEWPRARDKVYEHFGMIFRRQCNQLESLAKQSNHEGATFTYLQMTSTCVQCHDYVRDSLRVAERGRNGVQLIPAKWPERSVNTTKLPK
ncbi:MAG: hypothetical protein AB8B91_07785 [Rubripirellula sp.]